MLDLEFRHQDIFVCLSTEQEICSGIVLTRKSFFLNRNWTLSFVLCPGDAHFGEGGQDGSPAFLKFMFTHVLPIRKWGRNSEFRSRLHPKLLCVSLSGSEKHNGAYACRAEIVVWVTGWVTYPRTIGTISKLLKHSLAGHTRTQVSAASLPCVF